MLQKIYTKQTSSVTSDILADYIISQKGTTRKVLRATIVENPKDKDACISCTIFHQRKGRNQEWEDTEAIDLKTLKAGEGVRFNLSCSETKALLSHLKSAYELGNNGVQKGIQEYVLASNQDVVIPAGMESKYILKLLKQGWSEDIWRQLVENNPDLATKLSYSRIQANRSNTLHEFEKSMTENKPESYWQKFLSDNDWIFGYGLSYNLLSIETEQVYVGGKDINGRGGQICDFLAKSEGEAKFTALVEIKRANTPLLGQEDRNGCFPVSKELTMAVSQIQGYCASWGVNSLTESQNLELEKGILTVQPQGIIVIGNSAELKSRGQKKSFELFRRNLHNPEIITYDELLARAKFITNIPEEENSDVNEILDIDFDGLPF